MIEFKKPDLKAPRYRIDRMLLLNKALYKRFIKQFPEHKDTTLDQFKTIIKTFNGEMWDTAVHTRDGVEFPEGLGFTFIGTCAPPKKKNTDHVTSAKFNTRISHRNFESDNFLAKIFYTNFASKYKFKDREVWKFIGTRAYKRTVAKVYPEKWKMYIQVDNFQRISKMYDKHRKRDLAIRLAKPVESDYNEFAID